MVYKSLKDRIAHTRKINIETKEKQYFYILKKYGLTPDDKLRMAREQQWKCANLKCVAYLNWSNIRKIHVDHCHKTGITRGLLCNGCNTTLGHLEKESIKLQGLREYAERYKISTRGGS